MRQISLATDIQNIEPTQQLDKNDREDFNYFVNTESSFNPHNMFICRSKK